MTSTLSKIGIRSNIVILGALARAYANGSGKSPVRGWGSMEPNRSIIIGNETWAMSPVRNEGQPGVRVTVRNTASQEVERDFFLPWASLHEVEIELEGVDLR